MARACVYPGIGRREHASIPEPVDPGMRLFRGRLAQACVYSGIGRPEHASIPGSVGQRSMRLSRVDPGMRLFWLWPKHASIPGSVGLSVYPGAGCEHASIPGLERASAGSTMRLFRDRWPEHASISGSADSSMRLSRDRSAGACVPDSRACVGRLNHREFHASISGSMRLSG